MRSLIVLTFLAGCSSDTVEELQDRDVTTLDLFEEPGAGEVFDLDVASSNPSIVFTGVGSAGDQNGTWTAWDARAVLTGEGLDSMDLHVLVDTTTVETGNGILTNHLKTDDFFDVENHPTAELRAIDIVPVEGDTYRINGELTLRGTTAGLSWEATITREGDQISSTAEMTLSRMTWGIYPPGTTEPGADNVEDEVDLTYDVTLALITE